MRVRQVKESTSAWAPRLPDAKKTTLLLTVRRVVELKEMSLQLALYVREGPEYDVWVKEDGWMLTRLAKGTIGLDVDDFGNEMDGG